MAVDFYSNHLSFASHFDHVTYTMRLLGVMDVLLVVLFADLKIIMHIHMTVFQYDVIETILHLEISRCEEINSISVPSNYVNQWCHIVNGALWNNAQRHFNQNTLIFIQQNTAENFVCNMAANLFTPQIVETICYHISSTWNLCLKFISLYWIYCRIYGTSSLTVSGGRPWASHSAQSPTLSAAGVRTRLVSSRLTPLTCDGSDLRRLERTGGPQILQSETIRSHPMSWTFTVFIYKMDTTATAIYHIILD